MGYIGLDTVMIV